MSATDARVLDASVLVKCFLIEEGSEAARAAVGARGDWIAPDLIALEVANVALKTFRRRLIDRPFAEAMAARAPDLLERLAPTPPLVARALAIAASGAISTYDATYLALAEETGSSVLTADFKLVARARESGLGHLVQGLASTAPVVR